jgi:FtsZ-interacting cell division protein YlmF
MVAINVTLTSEATNEKEKKKEGKKKEDKKARETGGRNGRREKDRQEGKKTKGNERPKRVRNLVIARVACQSISIITVFTILPRAFSPRSNGTPSC